MANKKLSRQKRIRKQKFLRTSLLLIVAIVLVGLLLSLFPLFEGINQNDDPTISASDASSDLTPKEPYKIASASIGSTGDLLIHDPIFKGVKQSDGSYDFTDIFTTVKPYFEQYDLMVANLEVTAYLVAINFNLAKAKIKLVKVSASLCPNCLRNCALYDHSACALNRNLSYCISKL